MSRGVPTPRVPRTRELRTRGAPRGSTMLSIQLLHIRVMYARRGDVGARCGTQFPTTPCSGFLLETTGKKRGRILYEEEEVKDTDYQIAGVTWKSQHQEGSWVDRRMSLSWTATKKSPGHRASLRTLRLTGRVSPRAAVTEERPRTDSFKALPSLALAARRHFWPQESNTKKTRKLDGNSISNFQM